MIPQNNSFASTITFTTLTQIIKSQVARIPSSITGQKQISEFFSKAFEENIAALNPNWVCAKGDDNLPDIQDTVSNATLEIKVAMNKDNQMVICSPWRGGVIEDRLRAGWYLLFSRSRNNDAWAVLFAHVTPESWKSRVGYGGHELRYEHIHDTHIIPVIGECKNRLFALKPGFLPDYSSIDRVKCDSVNKLFQSLTLEEQSFILKQNKL